MKLLETIKYKNGRFYNLDLHHKRMMNSSFNLFGRNTNFRIDEILLETQVPGQNGTYKCRITYDANNYNIQFVPYTLPAISSLKVILSDTIIYQHKYLDRDEINHLYSLRDKSDDIIIVKNGLVTDSSYANLTFYDGSSWYTPAEPLLKGTKRELLLNTGLIKEAEISAKDISNFECVRLINAMIDFEDEVDVNIMDIS